LHAERKALQDAIDSLRFDCKIYEGYVPFQSSGFLPCVFNGTESGFEIYFGTAAESIALLSTAELAANLGIAMKFFGGPRVNRDCVK